MTGKKSAVFFALLAAALYAVNIPLSKLLEESGAVTPAMLAGLLYCGAGVGMAAVFCFKRISGINREEKLLCRKDLPYTVTMVLLDIAAPVLLMFGIANTSAFYSVAPFFGVGFSFVLVGERPEPQFYLALAVMAVSTVIMVRDTLSGGAESRVYCHTHTHRHGGTVHSHEHRHIAFSPFHIHFHSHTGTKI